MAIMYYTLVYMTHTYTLQLYKKNKNIPSILYELFINVLSMTAVLENLSYSFWCNVEKRIFGVVSLRFCLTN